MKDTLDMGWSERTVTVRRLKLLETLRTNRDQHKKLYEESVAGYRHAAAESLQKQVAKAQKTIADNAAMLSARIDRFDPDDPMPNQVVVLGQVSFTLEVPADHTKSYDVAIEMAEWEVGENIELTQSQFQCFVMDDWDWKPRFDTLNKSYSFAH
jgi:hypothetical protein